MQIRCRITQIAQKISTSNEKPKNELVFFETANNEIKLEVPVAAETVWLSANQMAALFDRDEKTIKKHINNVFLMKKSKRITTRKNVC